MSDDKEKVPVGTLVLYHGRLHVVRGHNDPAARADLPDEVRKREYPDGTGYELWPQGVPFKFGERHKATYYVRRKSFTVVTADEAEGKEA